MRSGAWILLAALLASPAFAQPLADPIGDILRTPRVDPDEPDTAAEPAAPVATTASPAEAKAYDDRLRASRDAAQTFQGALAGGWTLSGAAGDLYVLQMVDRNGTLEGAWRDPRRPGALNASGFIDQAERTVDGFRVRFGQEVVTATVRVVDGRWSGDLAEQGQTHPVSLRRGP